MIIETYKSISEAKLAYKDIYSTYTWAFVNRLVRRKIKDGLIIIKNA